MKNVSFILIFFLGLQHNVHAHDTIAYLDQNFVLPNVDRVMAGEYLYVKFTYPSKYCGMWEAELHGYRCQLEFKLKTVSMINIQREILEGKYRLMKGDTIIIDHLANSERYSDFILFATEKLNRIDLLINPKGLVSLSGEFELLNATLDSARLTLRSDEGIYIRQSQQREKIRDEIEKFFAPGVIFTRKEW